MSYDWNLTEICQKFSGEQFSQYQLLCKVYYTSICIYDSYFIIDRLQDVLIVLNNS